MNYKVIPTPEFIKNLKILKKKYKNIKSDVLKLANELEKNPTMGVELGKNIFKIRVKNSDNNRGKSAGYRTITYSLNEKREVFLVTIYSKSEKENILGSELRELIEKLKS